MIELVADRDTIPLAQWLATFHASPHDADVPCGDCNACCRAGLFVHISPDEHATLARIPKQLLFAAPGLPKGHRLLGYDQRGHCPMLREGRCSIYDARPRTCREFDCRVFAVTGAEPPGGHNADLSARVKAWRVATNGDDEARLATALRSAAEFLATHAERLPANFVPTDRAQRALQTIAVAEELANAGAADLPLDELIARIVARAARTPAASAASAPRAPRPRKR